MPSSSRRRRRLCQLPFTRRLILCLLLIFGWLGNDCCRRRGGIGAARAQEEEPYELRAARRKTASKKLLVQQKQEQTKQQQQQSASSSSSLNEILVKAGRRGLGGGIPGALAGMVQVVSLMWLRTIINYQSRYGTTFRQAFTTLYREGGIGRFYRGLAFALVQAPLSRFVSTAANDGILTLLQHLELTKNWVGPGLSTIVASLVVGAWRMLLMPIDTCKTVLQVDSAEGFRALMRKVKAGKIGVLYQGALAQAVSSVVAHYPWFYIYNLLSQSAWIHQFFQDQIFLRNASIGFVASIVSDAVTNWIKVVKTTKQAMGSKHTTISYAEIVNMILAADGWKGLFGRGLRTRILANAFQSVVFTVLWRGLAEKWSNQPQVEHNKDEGEGTHKKE